MQFTKYLGLLVVLQSKLSSIPSEVLMVALTLTILVLPTHSEAEQPESFEYKNGLLKVHFFASELIKHEDELKLVTDKNVDVSYDGLVVCDAHVTKLLGKDKFAQANWEIEILHFYAGADLVHKRTLNITSPSVENGGIELNTNQNYKFCLSNYGRLFGHRNHWFVWKGAAILCPSSDLIH